MNAYQVNYLVSGSNTDRVFYLSAKNSTAALAYAIEAIAGWSAYAYSVRVTPLGIYAGQAA